MHNFLRRHLLLPAFETLLKGRKTFVYWRELEKSQWLPRVQLEALQFAALQRLLVHAAQHCPYYRDTWLARGLDVGQLQTLTDFQSWPVIDRDVVRDNRLRMRSQQPGVRLIAKATGGSSGVPLHFDLDPDSNDRRYGAWHRGYAWAKAAPGTKQLYLWGVGLGKISRLRRCKDYLYNRLYG